MDKDTSQAIVETVEQAYETNTRLSIVGGNTKQFYGQSSLHKILDVSQHSGIIKYEPTELVVTVRGGTLLSELEQVLADKQQMLAFEPPHFGDKATVAGMVASGLSGPSRPFYGAVRDYVLGIKMINGRGQVLAFGGEVMKNVAGYDMSRLVVGALGTLGVLLEVSLKVVPIPAKVMTLVNECDLGLAYDRLKTWQAQSLPLSAACFDGQRLYVRLSGASSGVNAAAEKLGGERLEDTNFWQLLKEQQHRFFADSQSLWRIAVPPSTLIDSSLGMAWIDWGGAQLWLKTTAAPEQIRQWAIGKSGHATLFRRGNLEADVMTFQPLDQPMKALHQRIKQALDPKLLFNPGRMYKEL